MQLQTLQERYDHQRRITAGWLLHYDDRLADYTQKRMEILLSSTPKGEQMRNGSGVSDLTASKGLKLERESNRDDTESWLKLIGQVELQMEPINQLVIKIRRKYRLAAGRQGWVARAQFDFAREAAKLMGVPEEKAWRSDRTLLARWDLVVDMTMSEACRRGLL